MTARSSDPDPRALPPSPPALPPSPPRPPPAQPHGTSRLVRRREGEPPYENTTRFLFALAVACAAFIAGAALLWFLSLP